MTSLREQHAVISPSAVISAERAASSRLGIRTWTAAVGGLVFASAVARILVGQLHTAPRYWPDEYVYSAISHSLAQGHLQVRDQPAAFYALLQPLLAAPAWHFLPVYEAYRVIQAGNAIAASLVVLPLWLLGRELRLPRLTTYLICVYALLVPTLAMIPVTITDFVAYPLAIAAVAVGVRALDDPTRGRQVVFLCVAALATLARIQYVAVIPAYLAAALILDRRRAPRRHFFVFLALAPAAVGAVLAVTGYYAIGAGAFRWSMLEWMGLQGFLLSLTAGVAIVPGAVAALLRPSNRIEKAFAAFTAVFILLVFFEASSPAASEGRYKERYLLAIVPLLAVAFGMYLNSRRSHRLIVAIVGAALIVAAFALPVSGYTFNAPYYDSQTLDVAWLLQNHLRGSTSSAVFLLFILIGAAVAMAGQWRRQISVVALPLAISWLLVVAVVDVHIDHVFNRRADSPGWIDRASGGASVTAVATPASGRIALLRQLYWNPSVDREFTLDRATPTDTYRTPHIKLGPHGELGEVRGYFLFDRTGTQAVIAGATALAANGNYTLFQGEHPRLRTLVENQLSTGWLSPYSWLRAWSSNPAATGSPLVRFTLSLPPTGAQLVHMQLDDQTFVVRPGSRLQLTCRSSKWPFSLVLASNDVVMDALGRPVTVSLAHLSAADGAATSTTGCSATPG
ncbi:MAG: hypothetical protein ACTHKS_02305 [Gaiellaceae bacterium]